MNNLQDWSLSSCISNWNDLETHSTCSRPVYSLQTSIRRINWPATHWGHVEGLLQHVVYIAPPGMVHVSTPSSDALLSSLTAAARWAGLYNCQSDVRRSKPAVRQTTLPDLSASIIPAASVGTLSDREHVGQYHLPGSLPHTFWTRQEARFTQ